MIIVVRVFGLLLFSETTDVIKKNSKWSQAEPRNDFLNWWWWWSVIISTPFSNTQTSLSRYKVFQTLIPGSFREFKVAPQLFILQGQGCSTTLMKFANKLQKTEKTFLNYLLYYYEWSKLQNWLLHKWDSPYIEISTNLTAKISQVYFKTHVLIHERSKQKTESNKNLNKFWFWKLSTSPPSAWILEFHVDC